MDRTSTHAQALTGIGVVLIVLGLGAGGIAIFALAETTVLAAIDAATLQALLLAAAGIFFALGVTVAMMGILLAGIHSSLVDHSNASRR